MTLVSRIVWMVSKSVDGAGIAEERLRRGSGFRVQGGRAKTGDHPPIATNQSKVFLLLMAFLRVFA